MIEAIIVDDEPRAIRTLQILLSRHCKDVDVIETASNIHDAAELINSKGPALIFLDINMPNGSGLELVEKLKDHHQVKVIFTTAHQEYAIKAFRLSAVDFLLKPIDKNELMAAVDRYRSSKYQSSSVEMSLLNELLQNGRTKKIAVNTVDSLHVLNHEDIYYLSSERNYTTFHLADSSIVASKSIGEYEQMITDERFLRVHRTYIINLDKVQEYKKKEQGVVLQNEAFVEVAKSKREELIRRLTE